MSSRPFNWLYSDTFLLWGQGSSVSHVSWSWSSYDLIIWKTWSTCYAWWLLEYSLICHVQRQGAGCRCILKSSYYLSINNADSFYYHIHQPNHYHLKLLKCLALCVAFAFCITLNNDFVWAKTVTYFEFWTGVIDWIVPLPWYGYHTICHFWWTGIVANILAYTHFIV